MSKYHIRYKQGFKPESDTYVFKANHEIVAAVPEANVVSVDLVETKDDKD